MAKFILKKRSNGLYYFNLVSDNGEVILASEGFHSLQGCMAGIEATRKSATKSDLIVKKIARDKHYFSLKSANGQILGTSEMYYSALGLYNALDKLRKIAPNASVEFENEDAFLSNREQRRSDQTDTSLIVEHLQFKHFEEQAVQLQTEIANLKQEMQRLQKEPAPTAAIKKREVELYKELGSKQEEANIMPRIHPFAGKLLNRDNQFRDQFKNNTELNSVVVSIDIRRSTELMLKAKSPAGYSEFITSLSAMLCKAIIDNYGIFDKFTGDGILAFFPEFYSGEDGIMHAIQACKECHEIFQSFYKETKSAFNVFIKDVGLGIGIDYGKVTLVNNDRELTIVGVPVVYACRMSGTPAHTTILNLPAFDHLMDRCGEIVHFTETDINIKHEGTALAYMVKFNERALRIAAKPSWTIQTDVEDSGAENEQEDPGNTVDGVDSQ